MMAMAVVAGAVGVVAASPVTAFPDSATAVEVHVMTGNPNAARLVVLFKIKLKMQASARDVM